MEHALNQNSLYPDTLEADGRTFYGKRVLNEGFELDPSQHTLEDLWHVKQIENIGFVVLPAPFPDGTDPNGFSNDFAREFFVRVDP